MSPNVIFIMADDHAQRAASMRQQLLELARPGQYKVRFVGVVLGRTKTREIQVNVSKPEDG